MAQVTVRINGYAYTLGCKDGEEEHLQSMADEVERRIEGIKAALGTGGEARMLVMASLMLADDLFEAEKKMQKLSAKLATATTPDAARPVKSNPKLGRKLGKLAKQAEDIAADLETP